MIYNIRISNTSEFNYANHIHDAFIGTLEISRNQVVLQFENKRYIIKNIELLNHGPNYFGKWITLEFLVDTKSLRFYIASSRWFGWHNFLTKVSQKIYEDLNTFMNSPQNKGLNEFCYIKF